MTGPAIFGLMIWLLYLRFIVPVLGVFYGTALIADEVEDKTITYLFTRPIPPRAPCWSASTSPTSSARSSSCCRRSMLVYFLIVPLQGSLGAAFPDLLTDLAAAGARPGRLRGRVRVRRAPGSSARWSSAWSSSSAGSRRCWRFPGYLKQFTVAYYLQALVPHAMPNDGVRQHDPGLFRETPGLATSLFWLAVIWAVFLGWGARIVERKEYVLEQ